MDLPDAEHIRIVRDYHERTKHRPDRFAASLGYLDWANQPDPFRTFATTDCIDLLRPGVRQCPTHDELLGRPRAAAALDAEFVGRLFRHSLALSAWKQAPGTKPWSLRINPSSGDLHPTEGYLLSGPVPGLIDHPGVFHYAPFRHRLERRCRLSSRQWEILIEHFPAPCLLIGLTSIYWREAWKYGERAFRYCHHDVGHAIGAVTFAARTLGWDTRLLDTIADADLNRLLGTHLQRGIEAEHADCLLLLYPADAQPPLRVTEVSAATWHAWVPDLTFAGAPNALSEDHHDWPVIQKVARATRAGAAPAPRSRVRRSDNTSIPRQLIPARAHPAEQIIRQRRSAVAMDGRTSLDRETFYQMLARTLPGDFPFDALPWPPNVSLAVFVHRIDGLESGLYLLVRDQSHAPTLRKSLDAKSEWQTPAGCPPGLSLYRLLRGDVTRAAKLISCDQDIAADGAFALAMLGEFESALETEGAALYPRLYWECGLIGQLLYLEAEAAGVRATGIGCFFDDLMHKLLGIRDRSWQSLYHFTVGGPLEDTRLKTIAPYAHLEEGSDA